MGLQRRLEVPRLRHGAPGGRRRGLIEERPPAAFHPFPAIDMVQVHGRESDPPGVRLLPMRQIRPIETKPALFGNTFRTVGHCSCCAVDPGHQAVAAARPGGRRNGPKENQSLDPIRVRFQVRLGHQRSHRMSHQRHAPEPQLSTQQVQILEMLRKGNLLRHRRRPERSALVVEHETCFASQAVDRRDEIPVLGSESTVHHDDRFARAEFANIEPHRIRRGEIPLITIGMADLCSKFWRDHRPEDQRHAHAPAEDAAPCLPGTLTHTHLRPGQTSACNCTTLASDICSR